VLIGGSFTAVAGASHPGIARLLPGGALDVSFEGAAYPASVSSLSLTRDGRILVGGSFWNLNGFDSSGVGQLHPDGSLDFSFQPGSGTSSVKQVIALENGKVLVCGFFSSFNRVPRNRIARLHADGSIDASFNPGAGPEFSVIAMAPQPNGKVVIGGSFAKVAGVTRLRIARLNTDGTLDTGFQPGAGMNSSVETLALAPGGQVIAGGWFTTVAGVSRTYLARLVGDTDIEPPPTPSGVTAFALTSSSLQITWNDLPAERGWKLERSLDGTSGWEIAAQLPWDVTSFTDANLAVGTRYSYRLIATNAAGASTASAVTQVRTLTAYEQWRKDHNIAPDTADDGDGDNDGMSVMLEYAIGLNPQFADAFGRPVYQILGDTLALSYRRLRPELLYIVESSTDMQNWSANDVNQGSGPFPIAWTPIGLSPQKFLRLRVVQP
jgi:uncharacterized delta-60 repeat protein